MLLLLLLLLGVVFVQAEKRTCVPSPARGVVVGSLVVGHKLHIHEKEVRVCVCGGGGGVGLGSEGGTFCVVIPAHRSRLLPPPPSGPSSPPFHAHTRWRGQVAVPSPVADALVAPCEPDSLSRASAKARAHIPPSVGPAGAPGGGAVPCDVVEYVGQQRQACAGFTLRVLAAAVPTDDACFQWASRWALACLLWCGFDVVDVLGRIMQVSHGRGVARWQGPCAALGAGASFYRWPPHPACSLFMLRPLPVNAP